MIKGKKERGRTMQRCSPEIIRYLHTAADRSRYYTDLARELGAFLHPEDRVCDAGCYSLGNVYSTTPVLFPRLFVLPQGTTG